MSTADLAIIVNGAEVFGVLGLIYGRRILLGPSPKPQQAPGTGGRKRAPKNVPEPAAEPGAGETLHSVLDGPGAGQGTAAS